MNNNRYNDYYLVNDEDIGNDDDSMELLPRKGHLKMKRALWVGAILFSVLLILAFLAGFVVLPLVFKYSLVLQQSLIFTRFGLQTNATVYRIFRLPEFKNHHVAVTDIDNKISLKLGLWHILPAGIAEVSFYNESFDFDDALKHSNYSVLLYFHGTGEDRTQSWQKYQLLRNFFHVIAFDYRGYGDSQPGDMLENNVVNDCVQVYKWLQNRTDAPIYIWGHSLGAALAASTVARLGETANLTGLIMESAFTTLSEELYHHPYVKYLKWLPWFENTVVQPLNQNGFLFNTVKHIEKVPCPILFLHAKDDEVVPYYMSRNLYAASKKRDLPQKVLNATTLILFNAKIGLNHYFIYRDSFTFFHLFDFLRLCSPNQQFLLQGSHQS